MGPDPERGSYRSLASLRDPDGNLWLLQEVTTRLPGRIDSAVTSFSSVSDLASALRRVAAAHGEHETRTGVADPDWPHWYAEILGRGAEWDDAADVSRIGVLFTGLPAATRREPVPGRGGVEGLAEGGR